MINNLLTRQKVQQVPIDINCSYCVTQAARENCD